jgi:hypothetical protein
MSFYTRIKGQVTELTGQFQYPNDGTSFGHIPTVIMDVVKEEDKPVPEVHLP